MKKIKNEYLFSAHDLVAFVNCKHLFAQSLAICEGRRGKPRAQNSIRQNLLKLGTMHEEKYVEYLQNCGLDVVRIEGVDISNSAAQETVAAMKRGVEVIHQGALKEGRWAGRADILRRIEGSSKFGSWSYEVFDVKLANETKAGTIIQLCLYSDILHQVQGAPVEQMHVVPADTGIEPQSYRVSDYSAYYRKIRRELIQAIEEHVFDHSYPEPVEYCDICNFSSECKNRWRKDDHLCLVADISKYQIDELESKNINTTKALSELPLPIDWKPGKGSVDGYSRIREQARLQVETRDTNELAFNLLQVEEGYGLTRLPKPSTGDIFFDIEGDRFVEDGKLEYLFGFVMKDEREVETYKSDWAFSRTEERKIFEKFVDFVMDRWGKYHDMHIYHYAHYEPSALKQLMGRYATREEEIDKMLRAKLFVDLYQVVKQSVRVGVESYSIKNLERLYKFERNVNMIDANRSLATIQHHLGSNCMNKISSDVMQTVCGYNQDDCASTLHLRNWLELQREELIRSGQVIGRPETMDGSASEKVESMSAEVSVVYESLVSDIPADVEKRSSEQQAKWILANILEWHRREDKAKWWEYFRLCDLTEMELMEEKAGLSGLVELRSEVSHKGVTTIEYEYPPQEVKSRVGDEAHTLGGKHFGKLIEINLSKRTMSIEKRRDYVGECPTSILFHKIVHTTPLRMSLLRLAKKVSEHGLNKNERYGSSISLLLRARPGIESLYTEYLEGSATSDIAVKICKQMSEGVLPIQGPPGTGKTFTGAKMICDLVKQGMRIGITANSHKVIENLLNAIVLHASKEKINVSCCQKGGSESCAVVKWEVVDKNEKLIKRLNEGVNIGAGTAWFWAKEEVENLVDILVVDEAAQMSLANVLAMAQSAKVVVLLGDPQQLDQPKQGSHPDGTDVSAMEYIVGNKQTMENDTGLFLSETWRLHPDICGFTSETFYGGRLTAKAGLERQVVNGNGIISGSGLRYCMVEHSGNSNSSPEEADVVSRIVNDIVENKSTWISDSGEEQLLTVDDILIITPYNKQVYEIQERLPNGRVGTVDKFQGQEAPIAVYSMATSSVEKAPRGMGFLYNLNRLNVATSRARCITILVSSPLLLDVSCRTPEQIKLINAFCRYMELAEDLQIANTTDRPKR